MLIDPTIVQSFSGLAAATFERQSRSEYTTGRTSSNSTAEETSGTPLEQSVEQQQDRVDLSEQAQSSSSTGQSENDLSEEEERELEELKTRDREVRAHEQAHRSRAGQYAQGATSYQYQRGPDGVLYAVGGEVSIDTSEVRDDPEATIQKMQTIRAAALAPSDPSTQDRQVAAEATRKEAQARAELARQRSEETQSGGSEEDPFTATNTQATGRTVAENLIGIYTGNATASQAPAPGSLFQLVA
jgi:hypothetical protein